MSDYLPTPSRKTAPNVRLVDPLKTQAAAKAKGLGISLNALVSLAVRQYLDGENPQRQANQHDPVPGLLASALGMQAALDATAPVGAPRQPAASAVGGRGAPLLRRTKKTALESQRYVLRRHGGEVRGVPCSRMSLFLLCPLRFVPTGILGASFQHEYVMAESYAERLWQNSRSQGAF
ncbi:hypothetical protein KCU57_09810 [Xanthomonas translucens]|uniref:hypothetical protein n=1 Tax=Xanthomonas campestris pv. translucens TaxID=343 RepID=UPI001F212BB0|nr:hypothetical protein [Xanthomonas translucens]UKE52511.1 hypothetical protein KCU57_09810 [Xanthomonas translucens]